MALLNCNECGKEISHSAASCPNCGCTKPFKGQKLSVKDSKLLSVKERRNFMKSGGKLQMGKIMKFSLFVSIAFFGFIGLAILGAIIQPNSPESKAKSQQEAHEKGARIACMAGIHQLLKDPDSVVYKHGPGDRIVITNGENQWIVQLKLKAKNSFNAYVPLTFECDVALDGQNYKLLSIKKVK